MLKDYITAKDRLAEVPKLTGLSSLRRIEKFFKETVVMSMFLILLYACLFQLTNEVMYVN
jgi:hypothetical protein